MDGGSIKAFLIFSILISYHAFGNQEVDSPKEVTKTKYFSLEFDLGTEFNFFDFKQCGDETGGDCKKIDFTGRKKRLDYNFKGVQTTNLTISAKFFEYLNISGTYGSDSLQSSEKRSLNPPDDAPSWMKKSNSHIYRLGLSIFDLKFSAKEYKFNSGTVNVYDVSGFQEKKINSFYSNIEFSEFEASYRIGKIYDLFRKKDSKPSLLTEAFLIPLHIGYIYNNSKLPVIPYTFKLTQQAYMDQYVYVSEGDVQQMEIISQIYGIGMVYKYVELFAYTGSARYVASDKNNSVKKYKSDSTISKIKIKYDFKKEFKHSTLIVTPYAQYNHYDFNDSKGPTKETDQKTEQTLTTVGGDFYIYTVGLNAGLIF